MAYTLVEAAKISSNQLQRGVIETVTEDSTLMQALPFQNVDGNAYTFLQENALPAANFRALNAAYTESTGTFTPQTVSLKILGGDADVDRFLVKTQAGAQNIADLRAETLRQKSKSVRLAFHDAFINGSGAGNEFAGLKTLVPAGQKVAAATNGLPVVGANNDASQAFLDKLDEAIALVDGTPDVLIVNSQILAKFRSAARRLTINTTTIDAYGKSVDTYQGIPLLDIGRDEAGNAIIPQTETQGSSSLASSIYAVRFGTDAGIVGVTNGGIQAYDLGEIAEKPVYRTRVEFYCGVAMLGTRSVAQLTGVLAG
ncbi:MAG: phage major capsid protein [Thermomicrobiales bacterium]